MRRLLSVFFLVLTVQGLYASDFVPEKQMKDSLLQMLADFTTYMKDDFQPCRDPNSLGETCGCFQSANTMKSNEDGVRSNADMGMVCAFLCRYGREKAVLPEGITWEEVERMALHSLVFAYSTHKANRLKVCADGRYWGSTSNDDHVWESSLWAMSVAYSAAFLWDRLSDSQRGYIRQLLIAECHYELERTVPTGYKGDTKAEENGWEACVLAATLGLFPDHELAPQWYERLRLFSVNSYSHPADATDTTVLDPEYDGQRVCDLYKGANLYSDYTLQNHNYFHTSYQNVVIQELGEAALALRLFQGQNAKWQTAALMHNCSAVNDNVLKWLALSDGELAMPNGNDWSMFLYDQMTSYSTMACMMRDADALLLENLAFRMIRHRQKTTPDGSWLLRSDIGARRMGVQAHRVMMTWLMHEVWPTDEMEAPTWNSFRQRHAEARLLLEQNIVRASTASRFTCFSWSHGLKSYTGYFSPHHEPLDPCATNLVVPFKAYNTGNLLGWYEIEGRQVNAVPANEPQWQLNGDAWVMDGHLLCNDSALDHRFAIYSTQGNAIIYLDNVRACDDITITKEKGGLLAISTDEMTATNRQLNQLPGWTNIDNTIGIIGQAEKQMVMDESKNNNSVMTACLYASYSDGKRPYLKGETVDSRCIVYYSNLTAQQTAHMHQLLTCLSLPEGWSGAVVADPDGRRYMLIAHFCGNTMTVDTPHGRFSLPEGRSIGMELPQVFPY